MQCFKLHLAASILKKKQFQSSMAIHHIGPKTFTISSDDSAPLEQKVAIKPSESVNMMWIKDSLCAVYLFCY